ncbi:MAG: hypothetical protein EAZ85_10185 [Bacteroidetes bacterium]|nr:MAG: hypothetical protein EAZ85_10185 [Bacteroidota bacterium]TAG92069.1 MAG: hypothetical protein EAZ20_02845 [Bacteroidota bacterium]
MLLFFAIIIIFFNDCNFFLIILKKYLFGKIWQNCNDNIPLLHSKKPFLNIFILMISIYIF